MRNWTVLALCSFAIVPLTGCGGGSDNKSNTEDVQSKVDQAKKQGRDEERLKNLEKQLNEQKKQGGSAKSGGNAGSSGGAPAPPSGGSTAGSSGGNCGAGLSVNGVTTCPFAASVRSAYGGRGAAATVFAYSPALNKRIAMSCSGGSPHVCTGGNSARVEFP